MEIRLAEHVARMGAVSNPYTVFVGIPEGERPLGRPRCRLCDNIKMYIK